MGESRAPRRFPPIVVIAIAGLLLSVYPQRTVKARTKEPPCAQDLVSCPDRGCAQPTTPEALANQLKRSWPSSKPVLLTLDDFEALQGQADAMVGQGVSLDQGKRQKLRGLRHAGREVNEGDLVQVGGYIVGQPSAANSRESANCRLSGLVNNDFHITIARDPNDTEFEGIVVKMIPQTRPIGWTLEKLQRVEKERWQVLVRGQLFYDNEHRVNDDPDDEISGQAKRFSLWEVHPVTDFYVCLNNEKGCQLTGEPRGWDRLEFALPEAGERGDLLKPDEVQEEPVQ